MNERNLPNLETNCDRSNDLSVRSAVRNTRSIHRLRDYITKKGLTIEELEQSITRDLQKGMYQELFQGDSRLFGRAVVATRLHTVFQHDENFPFRGEKTSLEATLHGPDWYLCDLAGRRMVTALRDNAVLLINNSLLLKYYGRVTALCIRGNDRFVENVFYSPIDSDNKEELHEVFDAGIGRVEMNSGKWMPIRSWSSGDGTFSRLQGIKEAAQQIPEQFPELIRKISRRNYRENNKRLR